MARIETKGLDQNVDDLRGHSPFHSFNDKNNPYDPKFLKDDEYNFISGMNLVASMCTDDFIKWYCSNDNDNDPNTLKELRNEYCELIIEAFAQYVFGNISTLITGFIDAYEADEE